MLYSDIFHKRGKAYHHAMQDFSHARDQEFLYLFDTFETNTVRKVVDVPSGGCYLKPFLPKANIAHVDPTQAFLNLCDSEVNRFCAPLSKLPFENETFEILVSLAGTHHMEDKTRFFTEAFRVLQDHAIFTYADVMRGSKEDRFLNGFVNAHNSLGHEGVFIDHTITQVLQAHHFVIQKASYRALQWSFASEEAMVTFVKLLFGIDKAKDHVILKALQEILGYSSHADGVHLNWGLYYIVATTNKKKG